MVRLFADENFPGAYRKQCANLATAPVDARFIYINDSRISGNMNLGLVVLSAENEVFF